MAKKIIIHFPSADIHPLLAQVPLTVSPFVSLPTATTLPYTYRSLPSSLPQSSTADQSGTNSVDASSAKFIVSSKGHAAHPEDIVASCQALLAHLRKQEVDAEAELSKWENDINDFELAEKRKLAPGWLDRNEKILEPARNSTSISSQNHSLLDDPADARDPQVSSTDDAEGAELDRAFGGIKVGWYIDDKKEEHRRRLDVCNVHCIKELNFCAFRMADGDVLLVSEARSRALQLHSYAFLKSSGQRSLVAYQTHS